MIVPVNFNGSVPANSLAVFQSVRFEGPGKVVNGHVAFALNTQRQLRLRFFVVFQEAAPTRPAGNNLLAYRGAVDYVAGDGQEGALPLQFDHKVHHWPWWLVVQGDNQDTTTAHTLDTTVFVEV